MIQQVEDRLARADEYMRESSFAKGVARSMRDLAEHIKTFQAGSDPARKAVDVASADLLVKAAETIAYAEKLEGRAITLRRMVGNSDD